MRPTKHIAAHLASRLGLGIIEANDKERLVEHVQAHSVPLVFTQICPMSRPESPPLGTQHSQGRLGDLIWRRAVCVRDDGGQVGEEGALGEAGAVRGIEDVEPVELTAAHDDNVAGLGIDLELAAGSRCLELAYCEAVY